MKIAYCIKSLGNSGGMERVLSTKANYFADISNYEVHIIVKGKKTDDLFFNFSKKIFFHYLNIPDISFRPVNLFFESSEEKKYKKLLSLLLEEIKPDFTISMFGSEISFLYLLSDGSKKILEFHFSYNYLIRLVNALPKTRLKRLKRIWITILQKRERYYAKKYEHVVLLTQKDKKMWGNDERFHVIPNPLSFESKFTAPLNNKKIIAIGRFIAQKGFDLLIYSFSLIKEEFPDWQVFIYGEGQDKLFLQQLINKLSLSENIFLMNPVTDVERLMLESSIFAFPSRYEGFGLVLLEAMTCGVPCVAFDCECGPSEIIKNNEDGFLIEEENIKEFAEKIKYLILNKESRCLMGENAKKNVLRFKENLIMENWIKYFNHIIYSNEHI